VSLAPMRSMDWRGRIGRIGAPCTAVQSPVQGGTKPGTKSGTKPGTKWHKAVLNSMCKCAAKGSAGPKQSIHAGGRRRVEAEDRCGRFRKLYELSNRLGQRTPRVAVPAHRPLSLARHRAHQTEVLMRSTASGLSGRPKNNRTDANTCLGGGEASKPGPTCNATELLGSRPKERSERAVQTPTPPGPTTRARESAGEMEHSPPCCRDPQLPIASHFLG
jgi:hypothetical protein